MSLTRYIMAALRSLFSRGDKDKDSASSITQLTGRSSDPTNNLPTRIDACWLQWRKNHVSIHSGTFMNDNEYNHARTSLSSIRKDSIARAVYLAVQLRRLRALCTTLEIELEAHKVSFINTNILLTQHVPEDLSAFLLTDAGINSGRIITTTEFVLKTETVWNAAVGVLGLLTVSES